MKRFLAIAILCAGLFFSCSKNSGPADQSSVQPNNKLDTLVSMSAKIGACSFLTTDAYGYNVQTTQSGTATIHNILITGSERKNDSVLAFNLTINGYYGPDTYYINPPFVTATWYVNNQRHYATWGNIVIKSDSSYAMIGSFMFLADSILVSDGVFNVLSPI